MSDGAQHAISFSAFDGLLVMDAVMNFFRTIQRLSGYVIQPAVENPFVDYRRLHQKPQRYDEGKLNDCNLVCTRNLRRQYYSGYIAGEKN